MLLQGALTSAAQGAGSELGANLSPAHPLIAGTVGSFVGGTAGDLFWDALAGRAPRLGKSAVVGGVGAAVEAATGALGVMGARGGGVSKRTVAGTLQQGPMRSTIEAIRTPGGLREKASALTGGRMHEMFFPPEEAAPTELARQTAKESTEALSKGRLSQGRIKVNRNISAFDMAKRLYHNVDPVTNQPLTQYAKISDHPYSKEGFVKIVRSDPESPLITEIPTSIIAKGTEAVRKQVISNALDRGEGIPREVVADFPDLLRKAEAGVDMTRIKDKIASLVKPNTTNDQVLAVNEQLKALLKRTPDEMSMRAFDEFIREHTGQVKPQLGNVEAALPYYVRKQVANFARNYRNTRVLPGAKNSYARASEYINDVKSLRSRLVNQNGQLKTGAEDIWRNSLRKYRIREAMQRYDKATNDNLFERASRLARKQDWSPEDGKTAIGFLEGIAGWIGRASVFLGRGAGKVAIAASRPVGHATSAAVQQMFESAMGQGGPPVERTVPYPWEEKPEP